MTEITRAPSTLAVSLSLLAAAASLVASTLGSADALVPAAVGVLLVAAGTVRGSRRALTAGGVALVGGVALAGLAGARPEPLLVGALCAVLAWDVGEHGIGVGEQLGREARTGRVVVVHAAASLFVGALVAAAGYGAFLAVGGRQPVTALVFLLLGGVALAAALRR